MNVSLVKAWLAAGAPRIEDLAPILGTHDINLLRVFSGTLAADDSLKKRLSLVFNRPVEKLFPVSE